MMIQEEIMDSLPTNTAPAPGVRLRALLRASRGRPDGLWRHRDFMRLWSGQAVSKLGSTITREALPYTAILALGASPAQMGLLGAAGAAPLLLIGLLDLVAALAGVLTVFFDVAYQSFLPTLVEREQLAEGNGKLAVSDSIAEIAGPPLGGTLVQLISGPATALLDALSFLFSACALARIRAVEPPPAPPAERQRAGRDLADGLRAIRADPLLHAMAAGSAI